MKCCALLLLVPLTGFGNQVEYDLSPQCIGTISVDMKQAHCFLNGTPDKFVGLICDPNTFIVALKDTVKLKDCVSVHVVKELDSSAKEVRSNSGQTNQGGKE